MGVLVFATWGMGSTMRVIMLTGGGAQVLRGTVLVNAKFHRRYAGPQDTVGADVIAGHREAPERPPELLERQAGINQGTERHVARNP